MTGTLADRIPPITRPNGKPYQPRRVVGFTLDDDDTGGVTGLIVFGTHDHERAKRLADGLCYRYAADGDAVGPTSVWWRDMFSRGRREFESDDEHGRPGVHFEVVYA